MKNNNSPKSQISYFGKKVYYFNELIARKDTNDKNKPEFYYEDIEEHEK